jgi:hypothetical protein
MDLLGGMGQIKARFDPFNYSVNLDARFVHGFARTCNRLRTFWAHPMELLGDMGQVEACFDLFGESVNLKPR